MSKQQVVTQQQKPCHSVEISYLQVLDQISGYEQKMSILLSSIKYEDNIHYHGNNGGLLKQFNLLNSTINNRIRQISAFLTNQNHANVAEALQCIYQSVIKTQSNLINKILELIQFNQFLNNRSAIDRQKYILCHQCGKNLQFSKLQSIKTNLTICQTQQIYEPKKKAEKLKEQLEDMTLQPFFNRQSYQHSKQIQLALAGKNNPHLHRKSTTYEYLMEYLLSVQQKNLTLNLQQNDDEIFKENILGQSEFSKKQKQSKIQNGKSTNKNRQSNFIVQKRFDKMFSEYMSKSMQKPIKKLISKTHEIIEEKYRKAQPVLDQKGTQTSLLKPSEIMLNLQKSNENLQKEVEMIRSNKRKLQTQVLKYLQNQQHQDSKILQYSSRIKILQHQLTKNTHNYTKLDIKYKELQKKYKKDLDETINQAMDQKYQLKQQIKQLTRRTQFLDKNSNKLQKFCQTQIIQVSEIQTQTDVNKKSNPKSIIMSTKKIREEKQNSIDNKNQRNLENLDSQKVKKLSVLQSQEKQTLINRQKKSRNLLKKVQITISESEQSKTKKKTISSKQSEKMLESKKQIKNINQDISNTVKTHSKIIQFPERKQQIPIKNQSSKHQQINQLKRKTSLDDINTAQEKDQYCIQLKKCQFSKPKQRQSDNGLFNKNQYAHSSDNFSFVLSQYALNFVPSSSKNQFTLIKKKPLHSPKLKHLGKNQLPFLKLLKYHQNQQQFQGCDYQFSAEVRQKMMKIIQLQFKFFSKIGLMNFLDDIARLRGYTFDAERINFFKTTYQIKDWKQSKKDVKITLRNITDDLLESISQFLKKNYQPPNKNDIILFFNQQQAKKFEKKIGYWQQLDSMLVVDNSYGELCDLINNFFQVLKIAKQEIFDNIVAYLKKPYSYLYGDLEQKICPQYTKSLQISQTKSHRIRQSQLLNLSLLGEKLDRVIQKQEIGAKTSSNRNEKKKKNQQQTLKEKFYVRDLFKKLVRMHKLMHRNCSHVEQFLNRYGFKIYLQKKNINIGKLI